MQQRCDCGATGLGNKRLRVLGANRWLYTDDFEQLLLFFVLRVGEFFVSALFLDWNEFLLHMVGYF